ncbi:NAD(P)/FAD-dependent oxidoreductase [Brucella cytisi]|uniref:FAD-dependent oxidoreductase n=1 Tax=Brucella cytisi TaxID=407152 RepID=A0A1J6HH86_9HYPH|nr:FAD-binding oxidoreductase [Brucella cytisi]OIS91755.1 FAD-dependent oxidoreductase [Brucella cytisi]
MASSPESFSRSLWWNVAGEAKPDHPKLNGVHEADVVIVGGGFTGISSALFLAERGKTVVVLEARHVGFGASGRNGGQVIPGLKHDPEDLLANYGPEQGRRMIDLVGGVGDLVFGLVREHEIQCSPVRAGWIQAAHSQLATAAVHKRARQWQTQGVEVEILDRAQIAKLSGTERYFGGWRDPRAGALQPLDYVRGLARAATARGVQIFEDSSVTSLTPENGDWIAKTTNGSVRAREALVATNAYTGNLIPGLSQSILPVQSMLIATEPLSEKQRSEIMPGGVVLSETRKIAFYMRQSEDGRFLIGGRGAVGMNEKKALMEALKAGMVRLFPQLEGVGIDYHWSGHVALTMDGLPHLHNPAPGLHAMLGYNGRGVAMATAFGKMYAEYIAEGRPMVYPTTNIPRLAWHAIRKPVMDLGIRWYWIKDSLGFASK